MHHISVCQLTERRGRKSESEEKHVGKDDRHSMELASLRESNMVEEKSLGTFDGMLERYPQVPALPDKESRQMVQKMSKVLKPFDWEEIHRPTKTEVWAFAKRRLPFLTWIPLTTLYTLKNDIVAGFTILVMAVPQTLSYADIAGLPVVYGLYSTAIPCFIYAMTGNSRQLAVGPTALVAILTNAALDGLLTEEECPGSNGGSQSEACPEEFAKLAQLSAFVIGIIQIGAAFFQLGFIVQFLGFPVVSGFTSAAAFLIALTQVRNILGFSIERSQFIYITLGEIFNNIQKTNPVQAVLGFTFFFMLVASKHIARHYKAFSFLRALGPLILCVLASGIVAAANLDETHDVTVIGDVPSGLPPFTGDYQLDKLGRVVGPSITVVILSYMVCIANAKTLAAVHGYEVEPGQELFALGAMNLFGSMFSGFPVTGSFSRSAVANSVGAKTQLFGLVTGIGMLLSLVALTPIFAYLPNFVLGAIVLSSVTSLINYDDAIHLWKVKKTDCFLWFLAFFGTLFLGILVGLAVAAAASLVIVIFESVRPQVSLIWHVKGTDYYRSVKQAPNGEWIKGVLIVRFGAPMYFANMSFIRDTIQSLLEEGQDQDVKYVVLEMSPVTAIDVSAIHILQDTAKEFQKRGIHLCFANTETRVEKVFTRAGFQKTIGKEWFHRSTASAVAQCLEHKKRITHLQNVIVEKGNIPMINNHDNVAMLPHAEEVKAQGPAIDIDHHKELEN